MEEDLEARIADRIVELLTDNVTELNYIRFDEVKVAIDDFHPHEIPACQIWDVSQDIVHQRGYTEVTWSIALELILRESQNSTVDQKAMWRLRRRCELALWSDPSLSIPEVQHIRYRSNQSDLHLIQPHYVSRMDFAVLFRRTLTGYC